MQMQDPSDLINRDRVFLSAVVPSDDEFGINAFKMRALIINHAVVTGQDIHFR